MGVLLSNSVFAHHSFVAEFIQETGEITGVISKTIFKNPHVRFFVDVTDADGNVTTWEIQTQSTLTLIRYDIPKSTFAVGQNVKVMGFLGRENANKIFLRELTTESGDVIRPNPSQRKSGEYEEVF